MENNKYEKNRVLALYNILSSYTDEEHQMSMAQLRFEMDKTGNACSEDSILRYMKQLRNGFGVDIVSSKGRNATYFLANRILDKEELQVIIDAINASTVIDRNSTKRIVDKIKRLTSVYIASSLDRNILSAKNKAAQKKNILYRISEIQEALDNDSQILIEYVDWQIDKTLSKNGREYKISPWGLIWANERYYLLGYTVKANEDDIETRTFRVDKIKRVEQINCKRQGRNKFKSFDVFDYTSRRIDMYSDHEENVRIIVPANRVGIFIDRFGDKVDITELSDDKVEVSFCVACSNYFFGWLMGVGDVDIIEPVSVKNRMVKLLEKELNRYIK
ncbi:helix-turn-helix transcriptional regulator [Pseudobutyrivibrio ruminis]|uniref:WYL domain-containing protein n=1 Tax=Pseudobutyrivibrio ruminis TaxID=46206 RepID=A0A2G3DTR2_9FIRM|nr:WYL domain-containing protein [Pseudobutyrivibrio ruminis]PHU34412.1 hypothetical protein CSX01_10150 [Pseudobutyrivibrio ruminis]